MGEKTLIPGWVTTYFDERQTKQIEFSVIYAKDFHHGADSHNNMMIIAKFVELVSLLNNELDARQGLLEAFVGKGEK